MATLFHWNIIENNCQMCKDDNIAVTVKMPIHSDLGLGA